MAQAPNVAEREHHPDEATHPADHDTAHDHPGEASYIRIAIILAVITAAEVATFYFEDELGSLLVPALLIMMVVKFAMVAMWFMHLKFDSKLFSSFFIAGLALATGVYVAALATFHFFE